MKLRLTLTHRLEYVCRPVGRGVWDLDLDQEPFCAGLGVRGAVDWHAFLSRVVSAAYRAELNLWMLQQDFDPFEKSDTYDTDNFKCCLNFPLKIGDSILHVSGWVVAALWLAWPPASFAPRGLVGGNQGETTRLSCPSQHITFLVALGRLSHFLQQTKQKRLCKTKWRFGVSLADIFQFVVTVVESTGTVCWAGR